MAQSPVEAGVAGVVLVVDDDPELRGAVALALACVGYETLEASNGWEALETLRRYGDRVSLIVLDASMPRMDGARFRALQERDPRLARIPVVACSGSDEGPHHLQACSHLRKPFRMEELVARVRAWARPAR